MRRTIIAAALLVAAGCATAVSDSLERRGVSTRDVAMQRLDAVADAAENSASSLRRADSELIAVAGLDGSALANQIGKAGAACDGAAHAAQNLRIEMRTARDAGARWFTSWNADLAYQSTEARRREEAALDAAKARHLRLMADFDLAAAATDGAVAKCADETDFLKKNPSKLAASAHRGAREAFSAAAADAIRRLNAARAEATLFSR